MDVHQLSYGRLSVPLWTSISFHLDIHHLCVHPLAIKRTSIRTSVDVHQISYGPPSVLKLTSVSFYIDVLQYLCGRQSAFKRTSISTTVEVHQLSYGRLSVPLWTCISFHLDIHHLCGHISYQTDVHKNLCACPSVFIRTSISF